MGLLDGAAWERENPPNPANEIQLTIRDPEVTFVNDSANFRKKICLTFVSQSHMELWLERKGNQRFLEGKKAGKEELQKTFRELFLGEKP